jgi:FixJ family two-component response regulator
MFSSPLVCIVDNDRFVREAIEDLVQALGYTAANFASAEAFLLSGLARQTSCLVVDLRMHGMTGADLQDRLIAEGYRIPTIFLTAVSNPGTRDRVLKAGAVCVLRKPFDEITFLEYVNQAVKDSF